MSLSFIVRPTHSSCRYFLHTEHILIFFTRFSWHISQNQLSCFLRDVAFWSFLDSGFCDFRGFLLLAENNCFIMPLEFKAGLLLTTFFPFFGDGLKMKIWWKRVQRPIPEGPGSREAEREDVSQQPLRVADKVGFCDFWVDVARGCGFATKHTSEIFYE